MANPPLLQIEPQGATAPPRGFALWALAFRPFYLLASSFAALSVLLWIAAYTGYWPAIYGRNPVWHAHEMVYGFTTAVIVGFLFTAGRNWSNQPTPTGRLLMALALLWVMGRVLVFTPWVLASAVVNAAFPIAAGLLLGIPLARAENRRNYFFVVLLLVIGLAELAVNLAQAGVFLLPARASLQVALDVVLFILAVMGGRVIPMFTNNGVPGTQASRRPWLERTALGSIIVLFAADLWGVVPPLVMVAILVVATVAHAARLGLWQPWRTLRTPLVWILHVGYAWVVVHLAMRALAQFYIVTGSLATHALTIGAIGSLTIGMMTRTAKGHTGRPLKATSTEVVAYLLVEAAAIVRVFGGLFFPPHYVTTVVVAGLAWAAAFALYAVLYWPVLSRPRLDGKPG